MYEDYGDGDAPLGISKPLKISVDLRKWDNLGAKEFPVH